MVRSLHGKEKAGEFVIKNFVYPEITYSSTNINFVFFKNEDFLS
jgi:hypothetical protein